MRMSKNTRLAQYEKAETGDVMGTLVFKQNIKIFNVVHKSQNSKYFYSNNIKCLQTFKIVFFKKGGNWQPFLNEFWETN